MHPAPRSLAAALAAGTLALGLTGLPSTAAADDDIEAELLRLINAERTAAGLEPVVLDPALAEGAATWSAHLADDGALSHDPGYTADDATSWGENVGYTTDEDAAARLHQMLMESPEHRATILAPSWTVAGVGVAVDEEGRVWLTQRFASTTTTTPVAETRDHTTTLDDAGVGATAEIDAQAAETETRRLAAAAKTRRHAAEARAEAAAQKLADAEARSAAAKEAAAERAEAAQARGAAAPPATPPGQIRRDEPKVAPPGQMQRGEGKATPAGQVRRDEPKTAPPGQAQRGR